MSPVWEDNVCHTVQKAAAGGTVHAGGYLIAPGILVKFIK